MSERLHEKCAVTGIAIDSDDSASAIAYEALFAMQHRGTEATGIASVDNGQMHLRRERGLVRDVYQEEHIAELAGGLAIGHNRYSTNGSKIVHAQPVEDLPTGFALAHNGNLPVTQHLENYLDKHNVRYAEMNDSEMMAHVLAQNIRTGRSLPDAVELTYPLLRGSFSCTAVHRDVMVAFRDAKGIRPLALGQLDNGLMIASETCGLDIVGAEYIREIQPGEMLIITPDGQESMQLADGEEKLDMFEFVYFARHDSQLYGESVNEVRRRFGEKLAELHPPAQDNLDNILVVPVPDTSVPAAEGYADKLGLRHGQAIIKNRYIGRTFMQPNQETRKQQLNRKHNMISEAVTGRDIILIDDSIVRLNTIPRLVEQAYASGAKSVTVLIASPPVRFPDFYGIDTPHQSELAAANMTVEQMRQTINCQYLGFLSLAGLIEATGSPADRFNLSCFTGEYPIGIGNRKAELTTPVSMEYID